MGRGIEPPPTRQHQPQDRARLGIGGKDLAGRAVDQAVQIGQPAQHFSRQRAGQLFDLVAGFVYSQVLLACVRLRLLRMSGVWKGRDFGNALGWQTVPHG